MQHSGSLQKLLSTAQEAPVALREFFLQHQVFSRLIWLGIAPTLLLLAFEVATSLAGDRP